MNLMRSAVPLFVSAAFWIAAFCLPAAGQQYGALPTGCKIGQPGGLPLPSALPLVDYEQRLYQFLFERCYTKLQWPVDREVRDTGPFILGSNYGTHPAVRIYYSPEIIKWMLNDRNGKIPDGAMIIKEMFSPPAARYNELKASIDAEFSGDPKQADARFQAALAGMLSAWTVMVKDSSISKDGWFWGGADPGSAPDSFGYPFNYPASAVGAATCLRCHSSADSEVTFVSLSNIKGYEKYGDPLRFRVDNSWRTSLPPQLRPAGGASESSLVTAHFSHVAEADLPNRVVPSPPLPGPDPAFLATFNPIRKSTGGDTVNLLQPAADLIQAFPGQWADHVPAAPDGAEQFITSDNCVGCHGGLGGAPSGVAMFVQTGPNYGDGFNVSEFGEWRWSPMGLAGRDPIFFAQIESEFAILAADAKAGRIPSDLLRDYQQALANTCLSCHGAMGQRQLQIDFTEKKPGIADPNFYYPAYTMLSDPLTTAELEQQKKTTVVGLNGKPHSVYPYHKYGNLAREGISCTLCHHIDPPTQWGDGPVVPVMGDPQRNDKLALFLEYSTTGVFPYSPRDELNGPFADVRVKPMEHSLEITPKENPYIRDSKMCGTCHTINLPNVGWKPGQPLPGLSAEEQAVFNTAARNGTEGPNAVPLSKLFDGLPHSVEQATYLEWENSAFAWEPNSFKSCQDCHMPGGFRSPDGSIDIPQLTTQIATIQDSTYPEADHDLPDAEIHVPERDDYRRHELVGLNVFMIEMFNQFDNILGVDQSDPMTYATNGDQLAVANMLRQAQEDTVALDVKITSAEQGAMQADVQVTSKVGHRFPSGVGFRRAFLEVLVIDQTGGGKKVVWGSGRTNSVGVIVDGRGAPLRTEFLDQPNPAGGLPLYQKHHETVTAEDQVQIYEELTLNAQDQFTTSFIHRIRHPKDNRLLPFGFLDPEKDAAAFEAQFGASETIKAFMEATVPEGAAASDPNFKAGGDRVAYKMILPEGLDLRNLLVRATMYYQSIPPYYLNQRFSLGADLAPEQRQGIERLYYIASRLNTKGTPIENWKLPLVSSTASVKTFLGN